MELGMTPWEYFTSETFDQYLYRYCRTPDVVFDREGIKKIDEEELDSDWYAEEYYLNLAKKTLEDFIRYHGKEEALLLMENGGGYSEENIFKDGLATLHYGECPYVEFYDDRYGEYCYPVVISEDRRSMDVEKDVYVFAKEGE